MRTVRLNEEEKETMRNMPPLAHWPDREKPYNDDDSRCLQYIRSSFAKCESMGEAVDIWNAARKIHLVFFNNKTRLWTGVSNSDGHPAIPTVAERQQEGLL